MVTPATIDTRRPTRYGLGVSRDASSLPSGVELPQTPPNIPGAGGVSVSKQDGTPYTIDETELIAAMDAAASSIERSYMAGVHEATRAFGDDESFAALLVRGTVDELFNDHIRAIALAIIMATTDTYINVGQLVTRLIERQLDRILGFDQTNNRAVQYLQNVRFEYLRNVTAEQQQVLHAVMVENARRGLSPVQQARRIRASIGLSPTQHAAVENYRALLERTAQGDTSALTRQLRDHRFDNTVRRAAAAREPLTPDQIDRMITRYEARLVRYRATVIGQTESLRAVHGGNHEAYMQAIDGGILRADEIYRKWKTRMDGRERPSHHNLNGTIRRIDETFPGSAGPIRFPGDPNAPLSETVNCRCSLEISLGGPPAEE